MSAKLKNAEHIDDGAAPSEMTLDDVVSLMARIRENAVDRETLSPELRVVLEAAKVLQQSYETDLAGVKDPWVIDLIYGLLATTSTLCALYPIQASGWRQAEIISAYTKFVQDKIPERQMFKLRCALITKHYKAYADGENAGRLPSAEQMAKSAPLQRLFDEYLPGQRAPSLSAFKRMRLRVLNGAHKAAAPKLIRAAGTRRIVKAR
jgi:hypothetical protein